MDKLELEQVKREIQYAYDCLYTDNLELWADEKTDSVLLEIQDRKNKFAMETLIILSIRLKMPIKHHWTNLEGFYDPDYARQVEKGNIK